MCTVILPPGDNPIAVNKYTGLFEMIVGVLQTCHTLEIGVYVFFLFNRTTLQVFVTYLIVCISVVLLH